MKPTDVAMLKVATRTGWACIRQGFGLFSPQLFFRGLHVLALAARLRWRLMWCRCDRCSGVKPDA